MERIGRKLLPNQRNWFGWTSLVMTIVIGVLWMGNTPMHSDDYFYRKMPGPDKSTALGNYEGVFITDASQIPLAIYNHYLESNGRWANLSYLSMQLFPMRFIKYFCGALIGVLALLIWYWAGRRSLENSLSAVLIPIMIWGGFVWSVNMQSADFQFNYNIPALLLFACLILFFNPDRKPTWWSWLILFVFACWHECFTIEFGFFIGVQLLCTQRKRYLWVLLVLIAGFVVQFGPGTQTRTVNYNSFSTFASISWSQLFFQGWVSWVGFMWWIIRRKHLRKARRKILDRFAFGLMAAWVAFILMKTFVGAPERAEWGVDALAIAFVLLIIRTYRPVNFNPVVKTALLVLYAMWGANLVYWECKVRDFSEYSYNQMEGGNMVFPDSEGIVDRIQPFWLMEMPKLQYGSFCGYDHNDIAFCATERKWDSYFVLTDSLYGKPFAQFPKVPGKNDFWFATDYLLVREKDTLNLVGKTPEVWFGEPTLASSPLDFLLRFVRGSEASEKAKLHIIYQFDVPYQGDTLQTIHFELLPKTYRGRPITRIDF